MEHKTIDTGISHNCLALASIDGYAQGSPETILLKPEPEPLPSETLRMGNAEGISLRRVQKLNSLF